MKFLILVVFTSNVRVWGFQLSNVFTGPGGPPPRPAGTGWAGRGSGRSRTRPQGWGSWWAENIQSDQKIFARYAPGAVQLDALQVLAVRIVGVALVPAQVSLRHAADLGRKYAICRFRMVKIWFPQNTFFIWFLKKIFQIFFNFFSKKWEKSKRRHQIFLIFIFSGPHIPIGIIYCGISPGRDDSICRALEDLCQVFIF